MICKQCDKTIGYLNTEGYAKGRFECSDWDFEYTHLEQEIRLFTCPMCHVVLAIKEQEAIDLFVEGNNKKVITKKRR